MDERIRVFIERLVHVAEQSAAIDLRPYETGRVEPLRDELMPRVRDIGTRGMELLDEVVAFFEGDASAMDGAPPTGGTGGGVERGDASGVADLAFLGRLELGRRLSSLGGLGAGEERWSILTVCEGCLRKTRKAASAVEGELARRVGLPPRIRFSSGLGLAREIRRHYGRLRRDVEAAEASPDLGLEQRVHTGATAIARLVGREIYPQLRVADRAQLRALQERILAWMGRGAGRDREEGRHLWQDLLATTALLGEINLRSELVEADRRLVADALAELAAASPDSPPPAGLLARLEGLRCRDGEVDTLLDHPATSAAAWIEALRRLRRELR